MFTPIPGVPASPSAYGLMAGAVRPTIDRWESGLAWVPERCGTSYQLIPVCDEPAAEYDLPRPGSAYYQPVPFRIADSCSTMGGPADLERVRRVAEAQTPFVVARELWTGAGTKADPYSAGGQTTNAHLASPDADVVGSGGIEPLVGLGRLEQAAMEASHGQPIVLHVPVLVSWVVAGSLTKVGQSFITPSGNVVIADGAYTGTGPAGQSVGATVWAYATSPVSVLVSDLAFVSDDAQTVDRSVNTRTTWAERVFAATFDPCVHLATEIEI